MSSFYYVNNNKPRPSYYAYTEAGMYIICRLRERHIEDICIIPFIYIPSFCSSRTIPPTHTYIHAHPHTSQKLSAIMQYIQDPPSRTDLPLPTELTNESLSPSSKPYPLLGFTAVAQGFPWPGQG